MICENWRVNWLVLTNTWTARTCIKRITKKSKVDKPDISNWIKSNMILSSKRSVDESLYKEVLPNFFVRSILNLKPIFCGLTLATFDLVAVLDAAIQKCFVVNLNMLYSIKILERVYLLMEFYIHCVKSVRFRSCSSPHFPVFSPKAWKYGPE